MLSWAIHLPSQNLSDWRKRFWGTKEATEWNHLQCFRWENWEPESVEKTPSQYEWGNWGPDSGVDLTSRVWTLRRGPQAPDHASARQTQREEELNPTTQLGKLRPKQKWHPPHQAPKEKLWFPSPFPGATTIFTSACNLQHPPPHLFRETTTRHYPTPSAVSFFLQFAI